MSTFTRILGYARRYRRLIVLSFVMVTLSRLLISYLPLIGTKAIIDVVLVQQHYDQLGFYLLLVVVLYSLQSLLAFGQRYANAYLSQRVVFDVRNELFAALQAKSFSFYDRTQTGQLMSRMTTDVEGIQRFYSYMLSSLFGSVIEVLLVIYFLAGMDFRLTLIALAVIPPVFILNYQYMQKTHPIYREVRQKSGAITSLLQQNIVGMKIVRVFTNEELEKDKFAKENTAYFSLNVKAAMQESIYDPLSTFVLSLGVAAAYWYGGGEVIRSTLTLGSLLAFAQYMTLLNGPVSFLGYLINMYGRATAGANRIFEIMNEEPEVKDQPGAVELPSVRGEVRFEDVSFEYAKDKPVLRNINLSVKPGETIAILGATGSGKSTLMYLIPRFYDVTQGRITIDGYDVRDVGLRSLRSQIGIVLQDVFLFSATIRENIAFGKPDASMDEIVEAAKLAQLHDLVTSFPKGYDTLVGERGITLSGGQKQRVAIARTLLMNPRILIFDDSTSFVDVKTEKALQKAIEALLAGRTAFVITQRISTVKNADRIIVLERGEIAEMGTHRELLALNGIYTRIYRTQFAPQEELLLQQTINNAGGDGAG